MVFYTVKKKERIEINVKKSKFIATIFPVSSLEVSKKRIDEIKNEFKNATHYPYAFRIGHENIKERFSDDGEPPRSSGLPILQELINANLTNTLLVVTRYFGGIKLGLGGLNRAYRECASLVIDASEKVSSVSNIILELSFNMCDTGKIRNILEHQKARLLKENYCDPTEYCVEIDEKLKTEFVEILKNATKGKIRIKIL